MSEHDAHAALTATARLRVLRLESDDMEATQVLPVAVRRSRQAEARTMRADTSWPVKPGQTGVYAALPAFLKRQAD
jgi:hypothetical protein